MIWGKHAEAVHNIGCKNDGEVSNDLVGTVWSNNMDGEANILNVSGANTFCYLIEYLTIL